jgi:hypothetical protein
VNVGPSDVVAVYAALLATYLAYRAWWRGPRQLRFVVDRVGPDAGGPPSLRIRIVNVGTTPLLIVSSGFLYTKDYRRTPSPRIGEPVLPESTGQEPRVLDPGQSLEGTIAERDVLDRILERDSAVLRLDRAYAYDSSMKLHAERLPDWLRELGHEGSRHDTPPIVRSELAAQWLRFRDWLSGLPREYLGLEFRSVPPPTEPVRDEPEPTAGVEAPIE